MLREGLPGDLMLPWETLAVEASEPLAGLAAHAELVLDDGDPTPPTAPFNDAENAAEVWAWVQFPDCDRVRGTAPIVRLLPGLADAAGHGLGSAEATVRVMDVGPPVEVHEFDAQDAYGAWGSITATDTGISIKGGPYSPGGIAGLLKTDGKGSVWIRYREGYNGVVQVITPAGVSQKLLGFASESTDAQFGIEPTPVVGFLIHVNMVAHLGGGAIVMERVWGE